MEEDDIEERVVDNFLFVYHKEECGYTKNIQGAPLFVLCTSRYVYVVQGCSLCHWSFSC